MDFSSINFDTCWKVFDSVATSWDIYNEDGLLRYKHSKHIYKHALIMVMQ